MKYKNLYNFILCLFVSFNLIGQNLGQLKSSLKDLESSKLFRNAQISFSVIDIDSQKEVVALNSQKVLVPASSLKLFTNFSALNRLGEDFKFSTIIGYTGEIKYDGTLEGDLVIKGSGDPTLGSGKIGTQNFETVIKTIVNVIKSRGINCIEGDIVCDESVFDSYPVAPTWQWNDLGNYYAGGAWGININENQYRIRYNNNNEIGRRAKITNVSPYVPKLKLSNEVTIDAEGTGDNAYIFGGPYNYEKRIVGTIPKGTKGFTIKGSLPDPPYFLAYHIKKALEKERIFADDIEVVFKKKIKRLTKLSDINSPSLAKIIKEANFDSNNLFTEALLKRMGLIRGQGSGQNGINLITKELKNAGVNTEALLLKDGSGLSARNYISGYAMAKFISYNIQKNGFAKLTSLIPRGGYDGTVRYMFSGSKAKGNIWLKSGSMEAVQSYSGVVKAASGKQYSFCIIVNGFSGKGRPIRRELDYFLRDLYEFL